MKSDFVRILVIEDEVKLATHLSRALESEGHEARVVHDGKVALVEARDGNYELLVLDVELPRMDGFEILNTIDLAVRFWFRPKSMITSDVKRSFPVPTSLSSLACPLASTGITGWRRASSRFEPSAACWAMSGVCWAMSGACWARAIDEMARKPPIDITVRSFFICWLRCLLFMSAPSRPRRPPANA